MGTVEPQSSAVNRAFCVACCTEQLPATTVMAATSTAGERSAMIRATASSEAVSVSISSTRLLGNARTPQKACKRWGFQGEPRKRRNAHRIYHQHYSAL